MANNLTPEQIRQLQAYYANGSGLGLFQDGGRVIQSNANPGTGMDSVGATPATEYYGYDPTQTMPGQSYDRYGMDGTSQGQGQFTNDPNKLSAWDLAAGLAIGGGAMYGAGMFGGAGAGAAGGASGGGGIGQVAVGMDPFGVGTAYGLDSAVTAGAAGGAAGGALGASGGGGAMGGASGMGGAASGAGGLSSMFGGAKGLGTLATVAGGLLGSQKQKAENSTTKTMDPRLDGPVYGAGGLVPSAQGLLAEQMDPARQQQWRDMQAKGMGLLNTPMAGNGFAQFAGRKF